MAVANLNLPTFPTFGLTGKDTLKTRWNKYLKRFNILCKVIGVIDDDQKLSILFTFIRGEKHELYENIITVEESTVAALRHILHPLQILLMNVTSFAN